MLDELFTVRTLLSWSLLLLAAALVANLALSLRRRAAAGAARHAEAPGRLARRLWLAVPLVAVYAAILVEGSLPPLAAGLVFAAALRLWWTMPGAKDATTGEAGVARGFEARRHEELEEWRLTGDHLRFRLHGEWTSSPCPRDDQPWLRARLEQACPARESRFQD